MSQETPSTKTRIPLPELTTADIIRRFTYHPPKADQPERYEALRNAGKELAILIAQCCPGGREYSLALSKLEEAIMWANAGIARGE